MKKNKPAAGAVLARFQAEWGAALEAAKRQDNARKICIEEAKLEALQEKLDQLEDELTRVTSDEYIEQQARTHLRMIYTGETVYIVVPPEETSGNKAAN